VEVTTHYGDAAEMVKPKRILVVNDRREILELFERILTAKLYELFLYSYGMDELQAVLHLKPDLIILDYTAGREVEGWQLLQKIKMCSDIDSTPVIICTMPTTDVKDVEGYLATQEVFVLPKPFKSEALLTLVDRALSLSAHLPAKANEGLNDGSITKDQ
jgi:DNA-binding response OmpR family regulator